MSEPPPARDRRCYCLYYSAQPYDQGGHLTLLEAAAVFAAGIAAGAINAVVGSGSLITFPALLAVGYPPVLANVSNNVGLVPGSASAVYGYRRELAGQWSRVARFAGATATGAVIGALLLLWLPPEAFRMIVPVLIVISCVLVIIQPRLNRWLASDHHAHGGPWLWLAVLGTGVYGGYFGAAQGVILMGLLGIFLNDSLQRLNAIKNALALTANGVAAVIFLIMTHVDLTAVLLIAVGATLGGLLGASLGRKLPPFVLRGIIVLVGLAAIVELLTD